MTYDVSGGEAAGPLKNKRGISYRRALDTGAVVEARPIVDPRQTGAFATSLDGLAVMLGQYGEAAVREARLTAMMGWLMDPECKLSHDLPVVYESLRLLREKNLGDAGLPRHDGKPWPMILDRLGEDLQLEARKVVSDTEQDWKKARGPQLTPARIRDTHLYIAACIRALNEGAVH